MIPRSHITAWRSRAPWATDAQVEQDLVLSRALVALFQQPLETREFAVETAWFSGRAHVPVYAIEELLGTKLRALYQRRKGRDLFDIADALARAPGIRPEEITRCFGAYLAEAGSRVSRTDFEANLASKLEDHRFNGDIPPLLTSEASERYNPLAAGELVRRLLLPNLPAT